VYIDQFMASSKVTVIRRSGLEKGSNANLNFFIEIT
jgi:hypothetical protein